MKAVTLYELNPLITNSSYLMIFRLETQMPELERCFHLTGNITVTVRNIFVFVHATPCKGTHHMQSTTATNVTFRALS